MQGGGRLPGGGHQQQAFWNVLRDGVLGSGKRAPTWRSLGHQSEESAVSRRRREPLMALEQSIL